MMQISPEIQLFIREHSSDDVRALALQVKKYPDIDMPTAITQIAGRKVAAEKISLMVGNRKDMVSETSVAGTMLFRNHRPLQSTSFAGDSLTDLTGGFGIDCSFLATGFKSATYVERQEELCEIAAHNFPVLNLNHINIKNEDGVTYLQAMSPVDCLFLDPARRNEHGGKTVAISDLRTKRSRTGRTFTSKSQPGNDKTLPHARSFIGTERTETDTGSSHSVRQQRMQELLILLGQTSPAEISIHCVNLFTKGTQKEQHFVFTREQEQYSECTYTDSLETYLYEPNASLLKAGAFRSIAAAYPVRKLHPNSHLYTSDTSLKTSPEEYSVLSTSAVSIKKEVKENLADLKKANVTVRNFPATVAELRKRIHLAEGGDTYLFASTLK